MLQPLATKLSGRGRSFPHQVLRSGAAPAITLVAALVLQLFDVQSLAADHTSRPNVVVILADDLGYGDVRCFNPQGKIATPRIDQLAAEGMMSRDAHSGSAVCTPTRYGIMTGRYCWRTKLQQHVLGGLSPRLIEPNRETVASFLKRHGYATACIGKWHLGMDWRVLPGKSISELSIETPEQGYNVDYDAEIANGPNAVGFDHYFGISGSLDMVPYTFLRDRRVNAVPTAVAEFPLYAGVNGGLTRKGPAAEGFRVEDVLPTLEKQAVDYIAAHAGDAQRGRPFFLYVPLASPHSPIAPSAAWQGKSGLGAYADFVMETDACVGAILDTLQKHRLASHTLVIVTSDNGCSPVARIPELRGKGHDPCAGFRGAKADIYEGGHRVPMVARWPGVTPPGSETNQLVCLGDLFATLAEILGVELAADMAEDSFSFLPVLQGAAGSTAAIPRRTSMVHHSINGSFAIRQGMWKLCLCPDSGGWSEPRPGTLTRELIQRNPVQLFDLQIDPAESRNLAADHPEKVNELKDLLARQTTSGRSRP